MALAPDLALAVSHTGSGCVPLAQVVSYTVQVSNGASAGAVPTGQAITVSDTLPGGLSSVSVTGGSAWSIALTASNFTATYIGSYPVAPGASLTPITISGTVKSSAAGTQLTDSASVATPLDLNAANNAASDSMTACAAPDLSIVKTQAGNNPFHIGQQVTFSLVVSNGASAGPIIAGQTITVTDTLPSGLSSVSATGGSNWTVSVSGSTLTATYTGSYPVAANTQLSAISVTGTLTSTAVPSLANTATVSTPLDSNASNNSSTDTLTVDKLPDLSMSLTHQGTGCTKVGNTVSYTLQVSNAATAGPVPVGETITVSDTLPSALSSISASGGANWTVSVSGSTLTAIYKGSLPIPAGTALTPITVTGTLSTPTTLSVNNTATVSTPLDSNAANDSSSNTLVVCEPDLTVGISHAGGTTLQVGQSVTYTISSRNLSTAGPIVAGQSIVLSVTLPAGLSTITSSGTNWQLTSATTASGTTITAVYVGSYPLLSGASLPDLTVSGTLTTAAVPSYTATAVIKTPQDTNAANDSASDVITVLPYPDLAVALSHQGTGCFQIGQQVSYSLTVSNAATAGPVGFVGAPPITTTLTLPSGLSGVSVSASASDWQTSTVGNVVTATYKGSYPVAAGASLSAITVTGTLNAQATPTLVATASVSTPQDTNASNDTTTNTVTMCAPDLSISKTHAGGSTFHVGQSVTYTLLVSNAAAAGAVLVGQAITVTDTLPSGLSNVSATGGSDWTIALNGNALTATYKGSYPVASGAQLTGISITGTLTSTSVPSLANTATVSTPLDTNASNNSSTDTLTGTQVPDLSITLKHTGSGCTKVGDPVTYTLTVSDGAGAGPLLAGDSVVVRDTLPTEMSNLAASGGKDWTVSLSGSSLTATYKGSYPVAPGTTLPPITITGTLSTPTTLALSNTATVSTPLDSNSVNDSSTDTFTVCAPDLVVGISHAGGNTLQVGQQVSYTISSHNLPGAGPIVAGQSIVLAVTLPPGLTTITATPASADWQVSSSISTSGTTVTAVYMGSYPVLSGANLPDLQVEGTLTTAAVTATYTGSYPIAAGASLSPITISATISLQATSRMTETTTVSIPLDGNVANNSTSDTLTMCPPDLSISKTHIGGNTFLVGQRITYTLRVSNVPSVGPVLTGDPLTVTDLLPVGLIDVQVNSNSAWTITTAPSAAATSITATYTGSYPIGEGINLPDIIVTGTLTQEAVPSLVNSATVSTPRDSNAANDTAIDTITVSPRPDLSDVGAREHPMPPSRGHRDLHHHGQECRERWPDRGGRLHRGDQLHPRWPGERGAARWDGLADQPGRYQTGSHL